MSELRQRYPHSMVVGSLLYVSSEDSHDDISTIALGDGTGGRSLSITFEKQQRGKATYPSCQKLLTPLRNRFGSPLSVTTSQEERALNRRYEWKTDTEAMTLSCFEMPKQPSSAERLTIVRR